MVREVLTELLNSMGYFRRKGRTLDKTRAYVQDKMGEKDLDNTPFFHLSAPIGWLNDPNGFIHYKGKYHQCYQYNPYSTYWGPMYWGHSVSEDLITWEHMPVAMAPDTPADKGGVWSGSAIVKDNMLYVMYSGNIHKGQVQNIAYSEDGINFNKYPNNPVISSRDLPRGSSSINFRDPKIWQENGKYYAVIAGKQRGKAVIFRYISDDIYNWKYLDTLITFKDSVMRECPDYFKLDNKQVLLMSSKSGENTYILGNEIDNQFIPNDPVDLDCGLDFYAPQTLEHKGRRIMTAWMQSWGKDIPSRKFGYAGMMIIPRELKIVNDKLWIEPVKELENYRCDKVEYKGVKIDDNPIRLEGINGEYIDMTINVDITNNDDELIVQLMKTEDEFVEMNVVIDGILLDRQSIKNKINNNDILNSFGDLTTEKGELSVRIIIDKYAIEVFCEGKTLSMTAYPEGEEYGIEFSSNSNLNIDITKYNLRR